LCGEVSRLSVGLGILAVPDKSLTVSDDTDESVQLGKTLSDVF